MPSNLLFLSSLVFFAFQCTIAVPVAKSSNLAPLSPPTLAAPTPSAGVCWESYSRGREAKGSRTRTVSLFRTSSENHERRSSIQQQVASAPTATQPTQEGPSAAARALRWDLAFTRCSLRRDDETSPQKCTRRWKERAGQRTGIDCSTKLSRLLLLHLAATFALGLGLAANYCLSRWGLHVGLPRVLAALATSHARVHAVALAGLCPTRPWLQRLFVGPLLEEIEFRVLLPLLLWVTLRSVFTARRWLAGCIAAASVNAQEEATDNSSGKHHESTLRETEESFSPAECRYNCIVGFCSVLFGLAHHQPFPSAAAASFLVSNSKASHARVEANRCLTAVLQGLVWGLGPSFVLGQSARGLLPLLVCSLLLHVLNNIQSAALLLLFRWLRRRSHLRSSRQLRSSRS